MRRSILVLDDVDRILAGTNADGMSAKAIATLHALLRLPPDGNDDESLLVVGTTSSARAACGALEGLFERTVIVPPLRHESEVSAVLRALGWSDEDAVKGGEIVCRSVGGGGKGAPPQCELPIKVLIQTAGRTQVGNWKELGGHFEEWREMQEAAGLSCRV